MVALDQRESLRTMLGGETIADQALTAFKIDAARALTPHASAVLLDVAFGLGPVLEAGVLAEDRGLIVAADRLVQPPGGIVEDTAVDDSVFADSEVTARADAYKLLVIWRPGRDHARRAATVRAFLDACRQRGRPGIVEGIVRPDPGTHLTPERHAELVVEAAVELTEAGPDLYKAEVPSLGLADDQSTTAAAARLTEAIAPPWVVLSNGVRPERFDDAAVAAAEGGASGFLAGRAIWLESIAAEDTRTHLETVAAARLAALAERIDGVARPWSAA
jgi:sulfofructosephosphate aldolase